MSWCFCLFIAFYFEGQSFFLFFFFYKNYHYYEGLIFIKTSNLYVLCECFTLRSWLHEISTRIKFCPLDWRTTIHRNVVLAFFQHNHICQDCWKNTISTFECTVILQSRGQGPDSCLKNGTDLSRSSSYFLPDRGGICRHVPGPWVEHDGIKVSHTWQ